MFAFLDSILVYSYLGLYAAVIGISFATYAAAYSLWIIGAVRASRRLHQLLVESILSATLRFSSLSDHFFVHT